MLRDDLLAEDARAIAQKVAPVLPADFALGHVRPDADLELRFAVAPVGAHVGDALKFFDAGGFPIVFYGDVDHAFTVSKNLATCK